MYRVHSGLAEDFGPLPGEVKPGLFVKRPGIAMRRIKKKPAARFRILNFHKSCTGKGDLPGIGNDDGHDVMALICNCQGALVPVADEVGDQEYYAAPVRHSVKVIQSGRNPGFLAARFK